MAPNTILWMTTATVKLTEACSLSNKRIEQKARSYNRLNACAPLLIRNNVGATTVSDIG
jgi:hypothetical protein